ncbi:FxsA family protein [Aurantivibrio infirmus]
MPIAEMWLLIEVGGRIGALPTIGLVLLTAMVGLALLRQQGTSTLARANQRMQSGGIPAQEMAEGLFLAVGGALLLTPGFITDAIGFACLIPGLRQWLLARLLKHWQVVQFKRGGSMGRGFDPFGAKPSNKPFDRPFDDPFDSKDSKKRTSHTIEGDFRRDDD